MPNLMDIAQRIIDQPPLALLADKRCLSECNPHATCTTCADACPVEAVAIAAARNARMGHASIDKDSITGPRINLETCIRCGACVVACPTGALAPVAPCDDALLDACEAAGRAAFEQAFAKQAEQGEAGVEEGRPVLPEPATTGFVCARTAAGLGVDAARAVMVPCLAWVDAALILHAACAGAQRVLLLSASCSTCEHRQAVQAIAHEASEAQRIADAWGIDLQVGLGEATGNLTACRKAAGELSRRDLLSQARSTLADAASEALPSPVRRLIDEQSAPAAPEPDRRRWRMLDDLHDFGLPADDVSLPRSIAPRIRIDVDHCSGCTLCAQFCPTGALRKAGKAAGGATLLEFDAPLCRDCGVCTETCRYGALSCEETLTAAELFSLEPQQIIVPKRRVLPSRR